MTVLAFLLGLWAGVELIARAMGIVDVAYARRHLPPVVLRLAAVIGLTLWLAHVLGGAVIAGVLTFALLYAAKLWLWSRYVDWVARANRPIWTDDEADPGPGRR